MIAEPPSSVGASHETTELESAPFVAVTFVGVSGLVSKTYIWGSVVRFTVTEPLFVAIPRSSTLVPTML